MAFPAAAKPFPSLPDKCICADGQFHTCKPGLRVHLTAARLQAEGDGAEVAACEHKPGHESDVCVHLTAARLQAEGDGAEVAACEHEPGHQWGGSRARRLAHQSRHAYLESNGHAHAFHQSRLAVSTPSSDFRAGCNGLPPLLSALLFKTHVQLMPLVQVP
eukprot:1160527-Pelagomonas_calceolata.AAC.7